MTHIVIGQKLQSPLLRFDFAQPMYIDKDPFQGLRKFGPFDKDFPERKQFINAILMYPHSYESSVREFCKKLENGFRVYPGYKYIFRQSINIVDEIKIKDNTNPLAFIETFAKEAENYLEVHSTSLPDIVLVFHPEKKHYIDGSPYFSAKAVFAKANIPTQSVTIRQLSNNQGLPFVLANISLAIYSKCGGLPWVLSHDDNFPDLVIGVGRSDINHYQHFGFTTLFSRNGSFIYWRSDLPKPIDEYQNSLSKQIVEAIRDYQQRFQTPITKIAFHISGKRTGKREKEAVRKAIEELNFEFKFAIIHISDNAPYWIFDTSTTSYQPEKGLLIQITRHTYLITIEGRTEGKVQLPRKPIKVEIDKSSTISFDEYEYLLTQIYWLSKMNWRGFRPKNIPVSVYYPKLMSYLALRLKNWGEIIDKPNLRRKAWFL
jgi:argonaute-like protein implicated in RNA metabolism and viral defense